MSVEDRVDHCQKSVTRLPTRPPTESSWRLWTKRAEVQTLLDSAPPGTVTRLRFARAPVLLGEDVHVQMVDLPLGFQRR